MWEAYFIEAFADFTKQLALLTASLNFSDFVEGKLEMPLFSLKCAYNDEFGDYICTNEYDFISFDKFIRTVSLDVPYYLGGIMGYHY